MLRMDKVQASRILEEMAKTNTTQTAHIVEEATSINLQETAEIMNQVKTETLANLIIEIAKTDRTG